MNVDRTFSAPRESFALVQTLGFTGAERSNGTQITVGGVPVVTPAAIGGVSGYWNNLLATGVAKALSESAAYKNLVIDVKENTVILIQPYSDGNFSPIAIKNESNPSIGMTLNGPSGWVNGVWFGENPWSNFLVGATTVPSLVEVNVYTFGFTGGERSNGSKVTVGGSTFTTPIANSSDSGKWNNELARLHLLALDSNEQYGSLASDSNLNTSIVVAPKTFKNANLTSFTGESSTIGVSLDFPSGWNTGVWLGENPWSNYFTSYVFERSNDVDEGGSAVFTLLTKNIPANTSIAYVLSGVTAADINGGNLTGSAVVNSTGKATITVPISADSLTEGLETLAVTANGATTSIKINDTSKALATYELVRNAPWVDEGSIALFELRITNLTSGTAVPYTLSGISSSDVVGGAMSGMALVGANGQATINVSLLNDMLTEGNETLTVTAGSATSSITVNDTSKAGSTYTLSPSSLSVNEGSTASFTLQTKNLTSGSVVPYTLSGINPSDVVGGTMSGTALVGANGLATINVSLLNDMLTEGNETLIVNAGTASASISVIDTSLSANGKSAGQVFKWIETSTAPIIGSSSVDTFIVPMSRSGSTLTKSDNSISVTNNSSMVSASLSNVERIKFADTSVAFDLDGAAGSAVQMLGAVLGKDSLSNKSVVGIAIGIYDQALMSNTQVARLALDVVLGANPSNKAVVNLLYKNLIGIAPDALSESLFVGMINNGTYTQESITVMATNLDVNKTNINITGLSQTGLEYTPSLF